MEAASTVLVEIYPRGELECLVQISAGLQLEGLQVQAEDKELGMGMAGNHVPHPAHKQSSLAQWGAHTRMVEQDAKQLLCF